MIREKIYRDINETIDKHKRFESSDFKIESTKESRAAHINLSIKYLIEPKYQILFTIPSSSTTEKNNYGGEDTFYSFTGSVVPGPLAYNETFKFRGEENILSKITIWLNNIWEEISSNPLVKMLQSQQDQIEEIYKQFGDIKDEYFTTDEAFDLKKRLDNLEEQLKTEILKQTKEKEIIEEEVNKLKIDIETLKETIASFKKKGWIKSFSGKIFKWTRNSENRGMLKDGYDVIKAFLPEHLKADLP